MGINTNFNTLNVFKPINFSPYMSNHKMLFKYIKENRILIDFK